MAVVNCRECGKSVSTEAAACPHCGAPHQPAAVTSTKGLKPCKACKQGVSAFAKVCPHCGEKAPTTSTRETVIGFIGLCAVALVLFKACSSDSPPASPSTPASAAVSAAHQAKDFGITPDEFRDRYNAILGEVMDGKKGDPLKLQPLQISQGKNADSFKQEISKAATYVVGRSSKSSGKLDDLTIGIGGGNGKASTAANAMLTAITLTRAATGLSVESGVANVVIDVLGQATDQLKTPDKEVTPRVIQGYRISGVGLKDTGILLSVSPEK